MRGAVTGSLRSDTGHLARQGRVERGHNDDYSLRVFASEVRMRGLCLLLVVGCASDKGDDSGDTPDRPFPSGFSIGSATAGFQVDMGCPTWSAADCDDTASDWYQYVTHPDFLGDAGLHVSGEPVANGPGMWELYEQDIALMAADGHNSYRLSVEWSRLFPARVPDEITTVDALEAYADADAVARYHDIFDALRAAGITPMVTMNHYTLPLWIHDGAACHADLSTCADKGWVDADRITHHIGLYAGFLGREFGGDVDRWMTLNEPFATTLSGYLMPGEDRSAPPGVTFDVEATQVVMLAQIEGHAAMYHGLKAEHPGAEVGIVMNMTDIVPKDPTNENDLLGVEHMDYLYHRLYLDAATTGAWDPDLDGVVNETRSDLAGTLDVIGINYYNEVVITGSPVPIVSSIPLFDFVPEFSWEPHTEGLARVIAIADEYGLPIYITENGTPHVDTLGEEVLDGHLHGLMDAIDAGADVRGYHYWSFVDNYEWNHGFDLRFGLYALDADTKARVQRPVGARFAETIARGGLDD